jgi:hypothetical protein
VAPFRIFFTFETIGAQLACGLTMGSPEHPALLAAVAIIGIRCLPDGTDFGSAAEYN